MSACYSRSKDHNSNAISEVPPLKSSSKKLLNDIHHGDEDVKSSDFPSSFSLGPVSSALTSTANQIRRVLARSSSRSGPRFEADNDYHGDEEGECDVKEGDVLVDRYVVKALAGKGTFGTVLDVLDKKHNRRIALKVVRAVQRHTEAAQVEAEILDRLQINDQRAESGLVRLYKDFDCRLNGKVHKCLGFERLGRSLYDFLKRNKYRGFRLCDVRDFAFQLLISLAFCHSSGLVHTDLKPENILLMHSSYIESAYGMPSHVEAIEAADGFAGTESDDDHGRSRSASSSHSPDDYCSDSESDLPASKRSAKQLSKSTSTAKSSKTKPINQNQNLHQNHHEKEGKMEKKTTKSDKNPGSKYKYRLPVSSGVKLIDFGGATFYDQRHTRIISTRQYRAPEVVLQAGWTYPSDIWSAACIFVELFTGDLLFDTHDDLEHLALMEVILDEQLPVALTKEALGDRVDSILSSHRRAVKDWERSHPMMRDGDRDRDRDRDRDMRDRNNYNYRNRDHDHDRDRDYQSKTKADHHNRNRNRNPTSSYQNISHSRRYSPEKSTSTSKSGRRKASYPSSRSKSQSISKYGTSYLRHPYSSSSSTSRSRSRPESRLRGGSSSHSGPRPPLLYEPRDFSKIRERSSSTLRCEELIRADSFALRWPENALDESSVRKVRTARSLKTTIFRGYNEERYRQSRNANTGTVDTDSIASVPSQPLNDEKKLSILTSTLPLTSTSTSTSTSDVPSASTSQSNSTVTSASPSNSTSPLSMSMPHVVQFPSVLRSHFGAIDGLRNDAIVYVNPDSEVANNPSLREYAQFFDLIVKMLRLHPEDRLTARQALMHPFFIPSRMKVRPPSFIQDKTPYPVHPQSKPKHQIRQQLSKSKSNTNTNTKT